MTDPTLSTQLSALFAETGRAHHHAFVATDGADPDWPAWYAAYLQPRLNPLLHRSYSVEELTRLVLALEAGRAALPPDQPWPHVYAHLLLERLQKEDASGG